MTSALPPPGRWALGNRPREDAETLLQTARNSGLTTAWLGPEAGFLSNLSLRENLELFHDWQGRAEPFAATLASALALLGNDDSSWLEERVSQQPPAVLQSARLLRLLMLAPAVAVIEPADAARLLALPSAAFDTALAHSRLLLRGPASAEWPLPPSDAMLTNETQESSTP